MKKIIYAQIVFFLFTGCKLFAEHNVQHKQAAEANLKLGLALLKEGHVKRAKEKLLLAQALDTQNPAVWYGMGYFFEITGEVNLAQQNYLHAIAINPKEGAAQNNYGIFLYRQEKYREAIKHFLVAVADKNYLDTAEAYQNAGLCALKIPDQKLAVTFFKQAFIQNPQLFMSFKKVNKYQLEAFPPFAEFPL